MAKRKTTKKGGLFSFFSKKKKTTRGRSKKNQTDISSGIKIAASIIVAAILGAGGAIGLWYMDRSVKQTSQSQVIPVRLLAHSNKPEWLGQEEGWKNTIYSVAGGRQFKPSAGLANTIQNRLAQIPWLYNTEVKVTPEAVEITSDYRRPVAVVSIKNKQYYLDNQMYVFDYKPLEFLRVPEIKGISLSVAPTPGSPIRAEDIEAGVNLISYLLYCDNKYLEPKQPADPISLQLYEIIKNFDGEYITRKHPNFSIPKPLSDEIQAVDVTNYNGRKSKTRAHIVLYSQDSTPIEWGAALGQSTFHAEAYEEQKTEKLYMEFKNNTYSLDLKDKFKRIKLWEFQDVIPRPR